MYVLLLGSRLGMLSAGNQTAAMTGGLVQEFNHAVLPSVSPLATMILSALAMMVYMYWYI